MQWEPRGKSLAHFLIAEELILGTKSPSSPLATFVIRLELCVHSALNRY